MSGGAAVIGLEVHIQLRTESKLFCACPNRFGADPNTLVCPVCLGLPGALPALNRRAVALGARLALALGAQVAPRSRFARKHYFYPDLPKNYQISQYAEPLARGGALDIGAPGAPRPVALERLHLEEDTGKSLHPERAGDARASRVDFNRAGVPLVELVTRPELAAPEEAHRFLTALRRLARALGVTDGDMEKGSLRCDANVSLRPAGGTALGVKTEIKNLNSIRGVERALGAEIRRQRGVLAGGGRVEQCTLLYDAGADALLVMRSKEHAHDYRYFPEPDLPPLTISAAELEAAQRALPELPAARAARYAGPLGLAAPEAEALAGDAGIAAYFEAAVAAGGAPRAVAHWLTGEVARQAKERAGGFAGFARDCPPARLAGLAALVERGLVSVTLAKEVLACMLEEPGTAEAVARAHGLLQESGREALAALVTRVLAENAGAATEFRAGREPALGFLVGQLMRASGGRANPRLAGELLRRALAAPAPEERR